MKKTSKTLVLRRDTLRALGDHQLREIAGGLTGGCSFGCPNPTQTCTVLTTTTIQ